MAPPRAVPSVLHCRLQGARKESIREEVDGKFEGQVTTVVIPQIWSDGSYFYVGVYKTDDDDDDDNNNYDKDDFVCVYILHLLQHLHHLHLLYKQSKAKVKLDSGP